MNEKCPLLWSGKVLPSHLLVLPAVVKAEICSLQSQKRELKRLISFALHSTISKDWRIFFHAFFLLLFFLSNDDPPPTPFKETVEKKSFFFFGGQERRKTNEGADRKRSVHGFAWVMEKRGREKWSWFKSAPMHMCNARNMEFLRPQVRVGGGQCRW